MTSKLSFALSDKQTLPNGWKWSYLDAVSQVIAGNPAPQGAEFFEDGKYAFVRVQDMGRLRSATRLVETNDHINDKAANKLKLFPKGSVLFTKSGASTLLNQRAILAKDMYVVSHIAAAIPKEGVKSEWLYYWMKSIDFNYLAHATTLPSLPLSKAKAIPVPLAPYYEQELIVAEIEKQFSRLDEAVATLKRIKANLKRYKASVLKAAVEGKLTEEWRKAHPDVESASELLKRILTERKKKWEKEHPGKIYKEPAKPPTSNLPKLPKGWVWITPEVLAKHEDNAICAGPFGTIFKAKDFRPKGIPIIFLRHVAPGQYLTHKPGFMDNKKWEDLFKPYSVYGGELLITKLGEPPGVCAMYPNNIGPAMVTPDVIKMSVNEKIVEAYFLMQYFNSQVARNFATGLAFGTTRLRVTLPIFRDLPVPLPSIEEQRQIVTEVREKISIIDEIEIDLETNIRRAERLRQSILKKAFSGRLI